MQETTCRRLQERKKITASQGRLCASSGMAHGEFEPVSLQLHVPPIGRTTVYPNNRSSWGEDGTIAGNGHEIRHEFRPLHVLVKSAASAKS